MAVVSAPALAGFGYAPATSDRRTVAVEKRSATSLVEVARRLAPAGVKLRWDRRVAAGQSVRGVYGDWEALLFDAGLAWDRFDDEVHVRPAGLPAGEVQLASVGEGVADWRVKAEETLEAALKRWGARAGVDVLWLTDRRYLLHEERTFRGTWIEACWRVDGRAVRRGARAGGGAEGRGADAGGHASRSERGGSEMSVVTALRRIAGSRLLAACVLAGTVIFLGGLAWA